MSSEHDTEDEMPKASKGSSSNNNRKPDPRRAKPERRVQRSIGLPGALWKALDILADQHDAPVSRLIEQAVRHYLESIQEK